MQHEQYSAARRLLERARRGGTEASRDTWWPVVRSFLHDARGAPVLADALALRRWAGGTNALVEDQPPADRGEWVSQAYAKLSELDAKMPPLEIHLVLSSLAGSPRPSRPQRFTRNSPETWETEQKSFFNSTYLFPILDWLEDVLDAAPLVNAVLERWGRRTEWFGLDVNTKLTDVMEVDIQPLLHRYLFDAGVEVFREVEHVRGRVDFYFPDGATGPVELKIWRDDTSPKDAADWLHQAALQARDLGHLRGYLVVVNLSTRVRLEVGPDVSFPAMIPVEGVRFHIRVVDLGRREASKDSQRRRIVLSTQNLRIVI